MSDTPRSDKVPWTFTEADLNSKRKQRWVKIEFARELERENAALKTALDHQMTYQRELRADRDRLDWLMTQKHIRYPFAPHDDGKVLRERIDAAMGVKE